MISFTVPGIPISQPRQRHAMIAGHVRNYTPSKHPVQAFKAAIAMAAGEQMSGPLIESAVCVSVTAFFPRPKSKVWKKRPMPRETHTGKPDLENVIKAVQDALTGVVWRDDSQVCQLQAEKYVCGGDEAPRTLVKICVVQAAAPKEIA